MTASLQAGQRLLIHMSVLLDDGSIADSTRALGKPTLLQLGDGSLSEAMETELIGLCVGNKKKFRLQATDAFGESRSSLIQFIDRYKFAEKLELEVGKMISFDDARGEAMLGIVRGLEGESVKIDFNHPLAGEAITFDIEVLKINPPTNAEVGQGSIVALNL